MTNDVFTRHPLPWRLADGYPAQGFAPDDVIAVDANGNEILGCSEWFTAQPGVLEVMLDAVNLFADPPRVMHQGITIGSNGKRKPTAPGR